MMKQLEKVITEISKLSELEQENIAQIAQNLSKIDLKNLIIVADFVEFIKHKQENQVIQEITLLSQSSLAKDWLKEEEEQACKSL